MKKFSLLLFPMLAIALMMGVSANAVAQAATSTGDDTIYFVSY